MATLPTSLLHIFFEIILKFQDIVRSITDPDDNLKRNPYKC